MLCACSSQQNKQIKIDNFMAAILEDSVLQPGTGTSWDTNKDQFVKTVFGSQLLDPESDKFQPLRNLTDSDGNTYIKPPLDILFQDIDGTQPASVTYIFDADGKLNTVAYLYVYDGAQKGQDGQYVYDDAQMAQYEDALNALLALINSQDNALVLLSDSSAPDMSVFDYKNDRLRLTWTTMDASQTLEISATVVDTQSLRQPLLSIVLSNDPDKPE